MMMCVLAGSLEGSSFSAIKAFVVSLDAMALVTDVIAELELPLSEKQSSLSENSTR